MLSALIIGMAEQNGMHRVKFLLEKGTVYSTYRRFVGRAVEKV